jgi:Leucine-rich repeat (LRR) protein
MPIQDPRIAARIADCRQHRKTELNLQGTHSRSFPREILEFHWLRHLNIPGNLRTLPAGIDALSELETLRLGTVHRFPKTIGNLPKLQSLLFNSLQRPPEGLQHAQQIRKLIYLNDNPWMFLPDLSALTELEGSLSIGGVKTLPLGLSRLKKVEALTLNTTPLVELPAEIAQMTRLQTLNAARCGLERVHPALGKLKHLRHLDLSHNRLSCLPATLAALPLGPNADDVDGDDSAYSHTPGLQLAGNPIPQAIIDAEPAVQIAALSR